MTDFETGIAVGMLFGGKGGEDTSLISGVIDNETTLNIVTTKDETDTEHMYYYDKKAFTKSVTTTATKTTSNGTTTTTTTRTWTKNIIVAIYNAMMDLMYRCDTDNDGNVVAVYDAYDNEIDIEADLGGGS